MAKPKHGASGLTVANGDEDARAGFGAPATAAAAPTAGGGDAVPAIHNPSEKAGEGNEGVAAAPTSPSPAAPLPAVLAIDAAKVAADAITIAATPVVRVTAVRDRWRARRFWPKGDTDLTPAEADRVGQAGFDQLRDDPVFTITPLQAD